MGTAFFLCRFTCIYFSESSVIFSIYLHLSPYRKWAELLNLFFGTILIELHLHSLHSFETDMLSGKNRASHQCSTEPSPRSFFTSSNMFTWDLSHPSFYHKNEGIKIKMGILNMRQYINLASKENSIQKNVWALNLPNFLRKLWV
jgi:hypothetical protein